MKLYFDNSFIMRKLILFAAIALLCTACSNDGSDVKEVEAQERFGWTGPDLYGNVKSVTVNVFGLKQKFDEEIYGDKVYHNVFYFDSSTGNVTEAIYYDDGKINRRSTYSYDSNGKVLESKFYDENEELCYMWIHAYDSEGNLVEKCHRFPDGSLDSKFIYAYDSNGNLIEENRYDFRTDNEETKFVYVYDHRGNVIEENRYGSASGNLFAKLVADYDSTGTHKDWALYAIDGMIGWYHAGSKNLKQGSRFVFEDNIVKYPYSDKDLESVNQCDSTGMTYSSGRLIYKRIYSYNSLGQKIEFCKKENSYYDSGIHSLYNDPIDKFSYLYDSDGNLIERTLIDGGGFLDDNETYVYDSKGNMIEERLYRKDGSLRTKRICIYDVNGRKTEETLYGGDAGQPISKSIYEYDSKGNVIEVKDYYPMNWPSNVTQYEIEYYQ